MLQSTILSPQRQAHLFSMGVLVILSLGTIGAILACLAALWLAFQAVALLLASILECCQIMSAEYMGANSLIKFLLLASVAYLVYRLIRHMWRTR